jgi:hypothetical protein
LVELSKSKSKRKKTLQERALAASTGVRLEHLKVSDWNIGYIALEVIFCSFQLKLTYSTEVIDNHE